jgi:hypothetical protein
VVFFQHLTERPHVVRIAVFLRELAHLDLGKIAFDRCFEELLTRLVLRKAR